MISNFLKKSFLFCSGAHLDILLQDDCKNEHNKYVGIGTAVFFTGLFATISSTYALFTVFKSYIPAIVIGLIWGCFIFSLDRFIVATLKKENTKYSDSIFWNGVANKSIEIFKASPRIALAILLALIISKPLELKIFEREIENELISMQQGVIKDQEQTVRDRYEPSIAKRSIEINQLLIEIDKEKAKYDNLWALASSEADGLGGSKKRGVGKIFRIKRDAARQQEIVWRNVQNSNSPLISELRAENATDNENLKSALRKLKRVEFDGLLARIGALGNLTERDKSMDLANIAIILLFLCVELSPLIFKILTDAGNYDIKIQMLEERVYSEEIERISTLNDEINKRVKIKVGENQNLIDRELTDNKELMNQISNAQLSLAQEIIDIWKDDQMTKIRENPVKYVGGLAKEEKENLENGVKKENDMEQSIKRQ